MGSFGIFIYNSWMLSLSLFEFNSFLLYRITVLEKEDWKGVVDLFTNAKQVVSSVQDVARKLSDYAKSISNSSGIPALCLCGPSFPLYIVLFYLLIFCSSRHLTLMQTQDIQINRVGFRWGPFLWKLDEFITSQFAPCIMPVKYRTDCTSANTSCVVVKT